jgi:hypothetical protein
METFIPWTLVKRGVRRQVITPIDAPEQFLKEAVVERQQRKHAKDSPLIRALGLAHYWQRLMDEGKCRSLTEISSVERIDRGQANRTSLLTRLAPEIIQSCLSDHQSGAKLESLGKACQAVTWSDQKSMLAIGNVGSRSDS